MGAGVFDLVVASHIAAEAERARVPLRLGLVQTATACPRGAVAHIGVMANTKGGVMGWAGLAAPFQFDNDRWEIEPSAGLGAYHRGSGIDLGGTFEFHLGLVRFLSRSATIAAWASRSPTSRTPISTPSIRV